ncbi:MAG: hypothetical protein CL557_12280 [Alphaproteobacteria bacterium]|nr:hypothetical protein [Alphaproteobacteria bacterium]|tara:strand:- start:2394 stop:2918 length:525 start_codon:yes stop_codon:yes gene_type:complete
MYGGRQVNIYFLDDDPKQAARDCADQHLHRMMRDACLMIGNKTTDMGCDQSMPEWVQSSQQHAQWVWHYALALSMEWQYRFMDIPGIWVLNSNEKMIELNNQLPALTVYVETQMEDKGWRNPPRCIPKKYKRKYEGKTEPSNHVLSYRDFYKNLPNLQWTKRGVPSWLHSSVTA